MSTSTSDRLTPIPLGQIKVGGELGRRMRVTVENSLLNLDLEKDFLKPFREKKTHHGYTGLGLLSDYRFFKEERSLAAARKQADQILQHWNERPAGWPTNMCTLHMMATGLERAMYWLFQNTGDPKYRDFCVKQILLLTWAAATAAAGASAGSSYRYAPDAIHEVDLASDREWTPASVTATATARWANTRNISPKESSVPPFDGEAVFYLKPPSK